MGTRSAICYRKPYGSIVGVYCHYDGYPDHQLPLLREKYNTLAKAKALIKGGFMSSLEVAEDWQRNPRDPQPLYYTERGEDLKDNKPVQYECLEIAEREWEQMGCEYLYVYVPKRGWKYSDIRVPYPKGSDGEPLFTLS